MRTTNWMPALGWIAAVSGALLLAVAAPREANLMGRLPSPTARQLEQQHVRISPFLPAGRTLALVGFDRSHRSEIRSWIDGLRLEQDSAIAWFKMPVLDDPGSEGERSAIESRLRDGHSLSSQRSRLVPVFTNRADFVRAAGLSGTEHASVLVLTRDGRVLARAEGQFDPAKAEALRETVLAQGD
jgi:hypothetical protein